MSFFQNVFQEEFRGNWVLGDRQYSLTFAIGPNKNHNDYILSYGNEPYDFSLNNILTLNYAFDVDFKNYASLNIDLTGATTSVEVITILNSNIIFAENWIANLRNSAVLITKKSNRPKQIIRNYIINTGAEQVLRFNRYAPVAELPSYFERHTINNVRVFSDSCGLLLKLDENDSFAQQMIEEWSLNPSQPQEDWKLLRGRASGLFTFQKIEIDGNDRVISIIEYPAGAGVGFLGRKTIHAYTGSNVNPDKIFQIPYVITDSDLIIP